MDNFVYYTPTKVFFGKDTVNDLGKILNEYGITRLLLHYGLESIKRSGLYDQIIKILNDNNIEFYELGGVLPNPRLALVNKGIEICRRHAIFFILAVGGGSVIDSSKLIAAGAANDVDPWNYSIHKEKLTKSLKIGVILTISAAGSEMSDSCVITNDETKEKRGFSSEFNRPLFAIEDPTLTMSVSKYQTACGVVDIMMHTFERYFCKEKDLDLIDYMSEGLLKAVYEAGKIAVNEPNNYESRATLMFASSLSHNGLTGVGRKVMMPVHQIEHEISGMYENIAHGAGLAVLFPAWALNAYKSEVYKFARIAYNIIGISRDLPEEQAAYEGIIALKTYFKTIGMPITMKELGISREMFPILAKNYTFNGKRTIDDIIKVDYDMCLKILYDCE